MSPLKNRADAVISAISWVTLGVYLLIAASLSLLAIFSFYDVILQVAALIHTEDMTQGVLQVLHALLLTLIIVEILETVTAYFRTNRVLVTPILIAGITAMVRMARIMVSARPVLATLKRACSWSARANALTTRMPERFSWVNSLRLSTFCCTRLNMGVARLIIKITKASSIGSRIKGINAICGLLVTANTRLPTNSSGARTSMRNDI